MRIKETVSVGLTRGDELERKKKRVRVRQPGPLLECCVPGLRGCKLPVSA